MEHKSIDDKLTVPQMIVKLDALYEKKEIIERQMRALNVVLAQLDDDIILAEQMIMYASNKKSRGL